MKNGTIEIETNGHCFRVVSYWGGMPMTLANPFETLAEAEAFKADYERRFGGEWVAVIPVGHPI